jgi:enoyl-CoA hydratase
MSVSLRREGAAAVLTVDRPERKNALSPDTLRVLSERARSLVGDDTVRGVVLTGARAAGVFLAGGDLQELVHVRTAREARAMAREAHAAVDALRALDVPVVAAINADAFGGGCELAAACDYRVCAEEARFHWVQCRFAVTTGWGGAANLLHLVPPGVALRWLLTARPVSAAEAHAAGFVDERCGSDEVVSRAVALIEAVAAHPREGSTRMLALLRASRHLDSAAARALELGLFGEAWATQAHHDAVARFLSRRT